ncbi:MAG: hypothetical protein IT438_14560 [Phycisphaerales bacterium]|nr:hypothetical protein [Phycisphaerales bacterium]
MWDPNFVIDRDDTTGDPLIALSFAAIEDYFHPDNDDQSCYIHFIRRSDFLHWHTLDPAADGIRFGDARRGLQSAPWIGYRQNGDPNMPFIYDGGYSRGEPIACSASRVLAGPGCGQLFLPVWGAAWRCAGPGSSSTAISAMYHGPFIFFDPTKTAEQPWRRALLYDWAYSNGNDGVPYQDRGVHIAGASLERDLRSIRVTTDTLPFAYVRSSSNQIVGTQVGGEVGPIDNGAVRSDSNHLFEMPEGGITEGPSAFYNTELQRFYLVFTRNHWAGSAYQIVYRKSTPGAAFVDLKIEPWNDLAAPEQSLLRGDRHLTPNAASYGHADVFKIENRYYLAFHAKYDGDSRRTVFFKELTFDVATGDILELHETSIDPRSDISSFLVPVCRGKCAAADTNHDGTITLQDQFDFLTLYFAGDPAADFNRNGLVSIQDVFDFLGAYFDCPPKVYGP